MMYGTTSTCAADRAPCASGVRKEQTIRISRNAYWRRMPHLRNRDVELRPMFWTVSWTVYAPLEYAQYYPEAIFPANAFACRVCRVVGTLDRSLSSERIWRRFANFRQDVAVGVMKRLGPTAHHQNRILVIGPRAVGMDSDLDAVLDGLERVFEKRIRADAVGLHPALRDQFKTRGVLRRLAESHCRLSSRN